MTEDQDLPVPRQRHVRTMRARPDETVVTIGAPIERDQVDGLCVQLGAALERLAPGPVICDVSAVADADVAAVDVLGRLALRARRLDRPFRVRHPSTGLVDLLGLIGLADAVGLALEPERHAEEREDALGVEEEGDPVDPFA